jgi:hypothetical protein
VDIGDVTINNTSGAGAVNIQDGGNSITIDGIVSVSGSVAVTGPLTDAQLRASVVPVSLTSTTVTNTVAISAASLPLPSGAATSALQTTGNTSLSNIDTKLVQLALNYGVATGALRVASQIGNTTGAAAFGAGTTNAQTLRVVLPTDQTAIPVTQSTSPWVVSGTVTATNPSVSTTGSAPPASATYIGGSVTTAAPSYTTGQMSALSLNTSGGLRVDGSGVTQPISAASLPLPTGAATESTLATRLADATFTARINTLGQKTSANSTPVVLASDQPAIPITLSASSDLIGSGTLGALNATVAINTQGRSNISITVTGTWVATLSFEATVDSTNWFSILGIELPAKTESSSITTNKNIIIPCGSFAQVRIKATAYTSGTATVTYDASVGANDLDPTYGNNNTAIPTQSQLVSGSDGTNLIPLKVDSGGRLVTSALTGFGADFTFGDITTATLTRTLVKRTTYTEQTTNAQRSIASASANDIAAGTGARTVRIEYLDETGAGPFSETVTLNGTTYVNTVATNICFIEQIIVLTAGSTGSNAGILTLKAATAGGGATIGTITATNNQTFWAHHYIPTGKICNITGISCGHNGTTVGSGALFTLNALPISVANAVETQVSDFVRLYGQTSTFARTYTSPIKVTGPARIQVYVTPETTSSTIYRAAFDFFEP